MRVYRVGIVLGVMLAFLVTTGCGKVHTAYRQSESIDTKWVTGPEVREINLPEFDATSDFIDLPIKTMQPGKEYKVTKTTYEQRRSKEPNVAFIVALAGVFCIADMTECFGTLGQWKEYDVRQSEVASGEGQFKALANHENLSAKIRIDALDPQSRTINSGTYNKVGVDFIRVPIRPFIDTLSLQPAQIDIHVTYKISPTYKNEMGELVENSLDFTIRNQGLRLYSWFTEKWPD